MLVLANPFWLTLMITLGRHPWLEPNTDILNNLPVSFEFQSLLFQTTVSQPLKSFHILWTMKIFLELIHCLVNNELAVFLFISFAIMCSSTRWLPHLLILMCFSLSLWMPKEAKRHNLKKCSSKRIKFICPSLCICICTCIKVYLPNASVLVNSGLPGNCVLHSLDT